MSSDHKPKLRPEDVAATTAVGAATRIGTGMARRAATAEGAGAGAGAARGKTATARKPAWPAAILVVVVLAVTLAIMLRFGQ